MGVGKEDGVRIAFLSRHQGKIHRGGESFIAELSSYLSRRHEVDVLSGSDADNLGKIIKGRYDIVLALNGRTQSLKASLGRVMGRYKLVIAGESGIGKDDIFNIAVARPDAFVALTDYMYEWAKKFAFGTRLVKIPNGVDLKKFAPTGERIDLRLVHPVVISVGALSWYKHHERIIEAMAGVTEGSLLIVGAGEDFEKLTKLAEERIPGRYKIISAKYEELPAIYRSTDLFTLPSWPREAFGIVYLEALSSNLPVVAPDDLARREIVGDAGILIDVEDPVKYGEAVKKALHTVWGQKPRRQAEKFSWEEVGKKYEELFKELCRR